MIKLFRYSLMTTLLLAGCSHLDQYDADIAKQQEVVKQAQAEVDAEIPKCTKGKKLKDLPRAQYLKGVKCVTKLMEEKVAPVMPYPQPFKKFLYTNLENASLYSQGKISYEQVEARGKLAALEMDNEIHQMRNDIRQQLAQRDATERANLAKAMQGFEPKRPVYTNCSTFGNSTQCYSR
jgi:hypothetical protein